MGPCDHDLKALLAVDLNAYFDLLVLAYQQTLYALVFHIVRNRQDAEEVVQDAFIKAHRALSEKSSSEIQMLKLRPWLSTIAYHHALNYIRGLRSQSVSIDLPEGREIFEATEGGQHLSPEVEIESKETCNELYASIERLPNAFRDTIILHYLAYLPYCEIAEILHQPLNTVKSRGLRGLKMLHEMLKEREHMKEEVK